MKQVWIFAAFVLVMLGGMPARAAFPVASPIATYDTVSEPTAAAAPYNDGWHRHRRGGGYREARIAWFWAVWGIFLPFLGIFALVHGIRALNHHSPNSSLAVLAIIFGILELLACFWFLFLFFWWGPAFIVI